MNTEKMVVQPDILYDFAFNRNKCEYLFSKRLIEGKYTPNDILVNSEISCAACFVPAYQFHIKYKADWTAAVGYHKTTYSQERDEEGNMITKEVISTQWDSNLYQGVKTGEYSSPIVIANTEIFNDFPNISKKYRRANKNIQFDKSAKGIPLLLEEFHQDSKANLIPFVKSESAAFDEAHSDFIDGLKKEIRNQLPGDRQRVGFDNIDQEKSIQKMYLPFCYRGSYKYRGEECEFAVDGITEEVFCNEEEKPVDEERQKRVGAGFHPFWWALSIGSILSVASLIAASVIASDVIKASTLWNIAGGVFCVSLCSLIVPLLIGATRGSHIVRDSKNYRDYTFACKYGDDINENDNWKDKILDFEQFMDT